MTPDTSGPSSSAPFAFFDPATSCWRTSQATLDLGLIESSPTLPPSGSMRSGRLYERPTSAPATAAPACSSSLPTPTARDWKDGAPCAAVEVNGLLGRAVWALLPTPARWGNPFRIADCIEAGFAENVADARRVCVDAFAAWLRNDRWADASGPDAERRHAEYLAALPALRGHDLACWCPLDQPCHADVLLEAANR